MSKKYIMKPILKNEMIKSLFFNEIDSTSRKPEELFVNSGEGPENQKINKDQTITYQYNSLGFRSDEFVEHHDGMHILFAGCSETEGVGGSLESCWSYMTYKELEKINKTSGFFNLSRYGWGYDIIISNIMTYIKKYGKPNKIFILFPNIGRSYKWKDIDNQDYEVFSYLGSIPNSVKYISNDESWKRKLTVDEQRSHFINFTMIIKLFEDYCNSNSIDLMWSTWDPHDSLNYDNVGVFNNYFKMVDDIDFVKKNKDFFLKEIEPRKDWEKKRDGHSGYLFHYIWSKSFLDQFDTEQHK